MEREAPRRALDVALATAVLVACSPVLAVAAFAIRASSPGPVLYRAPRVGLDGRRFTMLKFRTMRVDQGSAPSAITASGDPRVFAVGAILRHTKVDELPQFWNVLRGDMAIVGPRPEDPQIVERAYRPEHVETLTVLPGLASPGSIFTYTHGAAMLEAPSTEAAYEERLLPVKLALDAVYVRRAGLRYDLSIVWRTVAVIAAMVAGRRGFRDPPEMEEAMSLLASWRSGPRSDPRPQGR